MLWRYEKEEDEEKKLNYIKNIAFFSQVNST